MPKALTVRGPFRGPTGYDHQVREFVRELAAQGVAVELQDIPSWSRMKLPDGMLDPFFESLQRPVDSRAVLHFCMPRQVVPCPGKANVNFTTFEADRVRPTWVEANLKHDALIVMTEAAKAAWGISGFPEHRVRICPLGVNAQLFTGSVEPLRIDGAGHRVRFLNVSAFDPRKNLPGLLEAWMLATTRADDGVLIVKLGCYEPKAMERFEANVQEIERRLGKVRAAAAPIRVMNELLPEATMPALYAAATHYISMSHGEGWDLPMMEAAASGLKLIAPAHSAYLTYLDDSIATLMRAETVPANYEGDPWTAELFKGANWWRPCQDDAIRYIRAAIDGKDNGKVSARERIARDYTWARATGRLIEILDEVESLTEKLRSFAMLRSNKTLRTSPPHSPSTPRSDSGPT